MDIDMENDSKSNAGTMFTNQLRNFIQDIVDEQNKELVENLRNVQNELQQMKAYTLAIEERLRIHEVSWSKLQDNYNNTMNNLNTQTILPKRKRFGIC